MREEPKAGQNFLPDSLGLIDPRTEAQTIPKQKPNRLESSSDFSFVFDGASADHGRYFTMLSRQGDLNVARLGVVVSKKNASRAVVRNRLKRIIRESFRQHQEKLPKVDIVVLAKRDAEKQNNKELFKDLAKTWQKLVSRI